MVLRVMILFAIVEKLKRQSKDDFKGRQCEAWLIIQAMSWYLALVHGSFISSEVLGVDFH
ncbi:hypothetical protein ROS1_57590 [Roseibium sp. ROS1]